MYIYASYVIDCTLIGMIQREAKLMLNERIDNIDAGYKCSRCSGMFASYGDQIVRCPFCSMICDEIKCRVGETVHEEY